MRNIEAEDGKELMRSILSEEVGTSKMKDTYESPNAKEQKECILVTGGYGYIGANVAFRLSQHKNIKILIADNLNNADIPDKLKDNDKITSHIIDIRNRKELEKIFKEERITGVIHLSGSKYVEEGEAEPIQYYSNNLLATIGLLEVAIKYRCNKFIFSSSAAVYGSNLKSKIKEDQEKAPCTIYAKTKAMTEEIIEDVSRKTNGIKFVILRYFNPAGADLENGLGEASKSSTKNLFGAIADACTDQNSNFKINGDDYDTTDGTCVRDFVHIKDLADGHIKALKYLDKEESEKLTILNLGSGKGITVKTIIETYGEVNNIKIPYKIGSRRKGDIEHSEADCTKARNLIGWENKYTLKDICRDSWEWEKIKRGIDRPINH